ncbi:MAG: TIR domain-containing protein [Chloroflexi bacterium]|nr:TIR domain-containing protein [Chloroflexota bacterium]
MPTLRAYISYAPANLTFVERIAADLTARSIQAVVDRGLMPTRGGSPNGWESVRAILERSDVMLLIASPPAIASADVTQEIEFAVEQRKLIIPLKLRLVSLPKPIDTIQWFDFEEGRYDRDLKYLLLNLAFVTPGSPPTFDPAAGIAKLPEPPDSLDALFIAATSAKARNTPEDRERAAAIYASILERDPNFQNGLVKSQLDELNAQLQDQRIRNLERYAADARGVGDWNREIAALNAWGRLQGERTVEPMLATARQNQQHANLYDQALNVAANDPGAAGELLRMLYQGAPNYGDPRGLAARLGVTQPAPKPTAPKPQAESQPAQRTQPQPERPPAPRPQPSSYLPPQQSAQPPTSPGTIQRPGNNPLLLYIILGGLGLVGGGLMGLEASPLEECFFDFSGAFICPDYTFPFAVGGLIVGLVIAFFIKRRAAGK